MLGLYIFMYLLIGAFILELMANISPDVECSGTDIALVICFWPFCIYIAIVVGIVYWVMSLGAWLGKLIRRIFIERRK